MFTFTFADCGENHVGNQQIGERSQDGFSLGDLEHVKATLNQKYGLDAELIDLRLASGVLVESMEPAYVLKVSNFCQSVCPFLTKEEALAQFAAMPWDRHYYDTRRKRVLNKLARSNNVVADFAQEPVYEEGKGTVVNFSTAPPILTMLRDEFNSWGPSFSNLIAEGNNYHTPGKSGIGWHGDTERSKVVAVRFGNDCTPIVYQWFHQAKGLGKVVEIPLSHGDLYIMSEKAVGCDWKKRSLYTLRHATGAAKYIALKEQHPAHLFPTSNE